jgi:hypothetical protein
MSDAYESRIVGYANTSGDACQSELHDDACKMAAELLELRAIVEFVKSSPAGRVIIDGMGKEPTYEGDER